MRKICLILSDNIIILFTMLFRYSYMKKKLIIKSRRYYDFVMWIWRLRQYIVAFTYDENMCSMKV